MGAHPADLAVFPLVDGDGEPGPLPRLGQQADLGRAEGLAVQGHGALQPLLRAGPIALDPDEIFLFDLLAGVEQRVGQGPVVGQEQQPLGVQIQTPHGPHPGPAVLHQVGNGPPPLLVGQGGHNAAGLIEHEQRPRLRPPHGDAVQGDGVRLRVGLVPQGGGHTVHRHPAFAQVFLRLAPGADAAGG